MSYNLHYVEGSHKWECERCGGWFRANQKRIEWTGAIVCHGPGTRNCWEPRNMQDFVRARKDDQSVPYGRDKSALTFQCSPIYEPEVFDLTQHIYVGCA